VWFAKAHGLGNDFILVAAEEAPADPAPWARRLCDRHTGIGADGIVLFSVEGGVARMRLLNADGSGAEISGNGLRCLAAHVVREGLLPPSHRVWTEAGPRFVDVHHAGGGLFRVAADLGAPILSSAEIPVALNPPAERVLEHPLTLGDEVVLITATSLGNPHCAVFRDTPVEDESLARIGMALGRHPFFPRGTNVEVVTVLSRDRLRVRFWERGVGYTRASGTGAASAVVAAILTGRADRRVHVLCDGGDLEVAWEDGGAVYQTGPAEILFEGDWLEG
jgi:diaminopimelate epimerase